MSIITEHHRELGKITSVSYGKEDHGILTFNIDFELRDDSSGQSFGNIVLDEKSGSVLIYQLTNLFQVKNFNDIVGKSCYVLRSWPTWGSFITGIEYNGKRFLLQTFKKQMWPNETKSELMQSKEHLSNEIQTLERQLYDTRLKLQTLENGYIDWSKEPIF